MTQSFNVSNILREHEPVPDEPANSKTNISPVNSYISNHQNLIKLLIIVLSIFLL